MSNTKMCTHTYIIYNIMPVYPKGVCKAHKMINCTLQTKFSDMYSLSVNHSISGHCRYVDTEFMVRHSNFA